MKQLLKKSARELGISDIGFTDAAVYTDLERQLAGKKTVFADAPAAVRSNPFLILPEAKSVIVLLCSYYTGETGNISAYAFGKDYHQVLQEKCAALSAVLTDHGYQAKFFCDTGDLCERYLAWRAGLGFFGKNGFLIHPRFGTYTFLAHILTDCPLAPDTPLSQNCAGCDACIAACPGGALLPAGGLVTENCLSYITQKKGDLSLEETEKIRKSGCAWGCDVCQQVCPHNRDIAKATLPEFTEDLLTMPAIHPAISNREFRLQYGNRAFAWRGKQVILRNLKLLQNENQ